MKTLKLHSFRMTIQTLLVIIIFTSSCAQTEKNTKTTANDTEIKNPQSVPSIDIHAAIITGNLEAVEQHIKAGTDINVKEAMSGSTPLMSAVTFNKIDIAKALIDANADLSLKNNDGGTALHNAAFFARIEILQMLIDADADKTIRNNFGATARETVMGDFAEVKPFYDMLIMQLKPMGFELDMNELQKARPVVAMMLE